MYTSIIKYKLSEIYKEIPRVSVKSAIDIIGREKIRCNYRPIHYRLDKIKNDNYFSLASNNFYIYI